MIAAVAIVVAVLCVWALVLEVRDVMARRRERVKTCAADGHDFEVIFAFDDSRYPTLNCKRCPEQIHVCATCGRDLMASKRVW